MDQMMTEAPQKGDPDFNTKMRRHRLTKKVQRAHEWRVQVWAQSERTIRESNAALEAMGATPVQPWEPRFDDPEALDHYATMTLTK